MRVKLGNDIYVCDMAACNSVSILLRTGNGIYEVECGCVSEAQRCYNLLLTQGWYDFSEHDYRKLSMQVS